MIKKLISLILLLIWVGIVWIFAFPEETKSVASSFWLGDLVDNVINLKGWLDNLTRDSDEIMNTVTDKVTNTWEDLKQKALEIKEQAEKNAKNILNTK